MSDATPAQDGVQPVMAPDQLERLVLAAATASASLIPSPSTLVPDAASEDAPAPEHPAYYAAYSGASTGTVVLILSPEMDAALSAGEVAESVTEIVQPALSAAAETSGPCVLQQVSQAPVGQVPDVEETVFIALVADGAAVAWVGLRIIGLAGDSVPDPRSSSENGPVTAADTAVGRQLAGGEGVRMELLRDVEMELSVEIGRAKMLVRDLLQLSPGSVVELDRTAGAPADLLVNGRLIARGEVVVVDEEFGLRVTQLVTEDTPTQTP